MSKTKTCVSCGWGADESFFEGGNTFTSIKCSAPVKIPKTIKIPDSMRRRNMGLLNGERCPCWKPRVIK